MANLFAATQVSLNGVNNPMTVYLNPKRAQSINANKYTTNYAIITFSAALIASNKVNMKIDGSSITEITYATSNAATLSALATEIATKSGVATATVVGTRAIWVYPKNAQSINVITDAAVTAGSSQASITISAGSTSQATAGEVIYKNADGSMTNVILTTTTKAALISAANTANTTNNVNIIPLTRKNEDGTTTAITVNVADIVTMYADPKTPADSIVQYMDAANDRLQVITVDETASAIVALTNA